MKGGVLGAKAPNKRILGDKIQCLLQLFRLRNSWVWVTIVLKYHQPKKKEQEVVTPARSAYVADFEKRKRR